MIREFITKYSEEYRIALMGLLGLLSGAVRICGNTKANSLRVIVSSLMASAFAGSLTAALLHERVHDIVYLGAACSMGGYLGQITLVIATKFFASKLGLNSASVSSMIDDSVNRKGD